MDLFESTNKVHCGEIFLSMDFTTYQKVFEINCILCGTEFKGFEDYEIHIQEKHFIKQEPENELYINNTNEIHNVQHGNLFCNEHEHRNETKLTKSISEVDETDANAFEYASGEICINKIYSPNKKKTIKSKVKRNNHKLKKLQSNRVNILKPSQGKMVTSIVQSEIQPKNNSNNSAKESHAACILCSESFVNGKLLFSHIRTKHKDYKPHKCLLCPKTFLTVTELKIHTRFHTGERPHLCPTCGKKFSTTSLLKIHDIRHHTFVRDKECPICKRTFMDSSTLKTHMSIHYKDRPYHCNICEAKFKRRFSLTAHMKSHENKREYKCELCSASFNLKSNLTSHKKKTHSFVTREN